MAQPLIDTVERAARLARTIASDISLYNEDKIVRGIKADTLFDEIADEIEEGRELFQGRVAPALLTSNLYERAIVDIIIKSKAHIPSDIW